MGSISLALGGSIWAIGYKEFQLGMVSIANESITKSNNNSIKRANKASTLQLNYQHITQKIRLLTIHGFEICQHRTIRALTTTIQHMQLVRSHSIETFLLVKKDKYIVIMFAFVSQHCLVSVNIIWEDQKSIKGEDMLNVQPQSIPSIGVNHVVLTILLNRDFTIAIQDRHYIAKWIQLDDTNDMV